MTVGKRIRNLRRERNLTQEYLAQELNVSRQAVSKWENGQSTPDTNNLIALAGLFQVSVGYLATGKELTADASSIDDGTHTTKHTLAVLGNISFTLFLLPLLLNFVGYLTGDFSEMMSVPINSRGDRLGIYWGYGDSIFAIILLAVEAISLVAAIVLLILYLSLNRKQKQKA